MAGEVDRGRSLQDNIKNTKHRDITQYSLFLGGANVKSRALEQYNFFKTGFARIFFVKKPLFMEKMYPNRTKQYAHMIEYGFKSIDGIQDLVMQFEEITGGYTGSSFEIPTISKDETNSITVKLQEISGSLIREYNELWINGVSDQLSGLTHYQGALDLEGENIEATLANQSGEFIYVVTDSTGRANGIEFACLLANIFPKNAKRGHLNYESGDSKSVEIECEYTCKMYVSPDINEVAKVLIDKYKILTNSLDFKSDYSKDAADYQSSNIADWSYGQ